VHQTFNFGVKWVNYVLDYEMSGRLPFLIQNMVVLLIKLYYDISCSYITPSNSYG